MEIRSSDLDHLRWLKKADFSSLQGLRVLDVGCGSGYLCIHARESGAALAMGVDLVSPPNVETSQSWHFIQADLDRPTWSQSIHQRSGNLFDLIFAFDIIEHLSSPWSFLLECKSLLAPGGHLILTTPNANSWERLSRPDSWSGAQDPQHKHIFSHYSLKFLLERAGFMLPRISAPMRSLEWLGSWTPAIGGQLFCQAKA